MNAAVRRFDSDVPLHDFALRCLVPLLISWTMKTTRSFYTITQAAEELGLTRQAVNLAIKRGLLQARKGTIKITVRGWTIPAKSLDAYRSRISSLHQQLGKKSLKRLLC